MRVLPGVRVGGPSHSTSIAAGAGAMALIVLAVWLFSGWRSSAIAAISRTTVVLFLPA